MIAPVGPLTRSVSVETLPSEGMLFELKATADECRDLAALDNLVAIEDLAGSYRLRPEHQGGVRVTGTVRARITQTCTVSLDAFDTDLTEPVDVLFLPEKGIADWFGKRKAAADAIDALEDEDPPDAIVGGRIDLGALTAEFLALGLDPYPRKPGVAFETAPEADDEPSPFAALAALKRDT